MDNIINYRPKAKKIYEDIVRWNDINEIKTKDIISIIEKDLIIAYKKGYLDGLKFNE